MRHITEEFVNEWYAFQSTHPVRGATIGCFVFLYFLKFQSTHPVRGATIDTDDRYHRYLFQSTHPVRGATCVDGNCIRPAVISIHAPREGCDRTVFNHLSHGVGISIHAPREGCDGNDDTHQHANRISIHAPREGCDTETTIRTNTQTVFQSTHPVRGATRGYRRATIGAHISIHAPREGCDNRGNSRRLT